MSSGLPGEIGPTGDPAVETGLAPDGDKGERGDQGVPGDEGPIGDPGVDTSGQSGDKGDDGRYNVF